MGQLPGLGELARHPTKALRPARCETAKAELLWNGGNWGRALTCGDRPTEAAALRDISDVRRSNRAFRKRSLKDGA